MTHEAKIASDEQVDVITEQVMAENKNLLKCLEREETTEIKNDQYIVGEDNDLEKTEFFQKDISSATNSAPDYRSVLVGDYQTSSTKRNKVELTTS